jgi:hypothetical protein
MLDLIVTMDEATSKIYSAFLVEEESTASTFQALSKCSPFTGRHRASTPIAAAIISTRRRRTVRSTRNSSPRSAGRCSAWESSISRPIRRKREAARSGCSAPFQDRLIKEPAKAGITEIAAANAWIREVYLPEHNARFAKPAALPETAFVAVADNSALAETLCVRKSAWSGATTRRASAGSSCNCPKARCAITPAYLAV